MTDPIDSAGKAKPARAFPGLRGLMLAAAFAATFFAGGVIMSGPAAFAMEHVVMSHGAMHARMQAHVDKMLTGVDATADQKTRIHTILKSAMESVTPLHERLMATHRDLHQILMAPTIDRAALEQLRAARLGDFDQASKVLVGAIADAAEVLTPTQRAKLGAMMAEHHHMDR